MQNSVYYEDVAPGDEIGPLVKHPTTRQLVEWAGAVEDFNPVHYDKDLAQSKGFPGVIVQGELVFCFLAQLMGNWIGGNGILKRLSCQYRGISLPNQDIICKGKVKNKYFDKGNYIIECDIWTENIKGEKTVSGSAITSVPSRVRMELLDDI
jgi:acyl dehydratase